MTKVLTGLEKLKNLSPNNFPKRIALLCHAASVDQNYQHALFTLLQLFGPRFKKIFSPQHGLVGNVQDNMVESNHYLHPYFKLPVYSLYSETRSPKAEWLEDIDAIFVDLQDVGTRIYTYIYTLSLLMRECSGKNIRVIVLDRPNPIDGETLEGNLLDENFSSFVGMHPLPVRHGLTMGEFAKMAQALWYPQCDLEVITMEGWHRNMNFYDTKLPWVLPSPNLATVEAAYTFVGSVFFEGTNISEGRGTTRSLEIIGHPHIEPYALVDHLQKIFKAEKLQGFAMRPLIFLPTFQKHAGIDCGGLQLHVTDYKTFMPWKVCQIIMRELYHLLGDQFQWKQPPYEYEWKKLPIDLINGTDVMRHWIEKRGSLSELVDREKKDLQNFAITRKPYLLYS